MNKYEENLRHIDFYNECIKYMMDDIYKVLILRFKYEGDDRKKAILQSKEILELISNELKEYLIFFKACIKEYKSSCEI